MPLFTPTYLPYKDTGFFSRIIIDYLSGNQSIRNLYHHTPDVEGVLAAIEERKKFNTNRELLAAEFGRQYEMVEADAKVKDNITALLDDNTFTICTAHQPNIFTGHLYFIYKIVHAVRLAEELNDTVRGCRFVPVYYMGSEDADLEELGEVMINGRKYEWKTKQKGAVGRMKIDKPFLQLIDEMEGQLAVEPFGKEIIALIRETYRPETSIEQATFELVNRLFGRFGLLVFLPDNPALKNEFNGVIKKELQEQFSHKLVLESIASFPEAYKVQAAGRELNLFYLRDDTRERIEPAANGYGVANTEWRFTRDEMLGELQSHPERFSPNVILRPVFQEMVLPNIIFIGGGGELAYWLELKKVFEEVNVPYPVLILRNSFTIINKKNSDLLFKLQFDIPEIFSPLKDLQEKLVKRESRLQMNLGSEKELLSAAYAAMHKPVTAVDPTLSNHVSALQAGALKRIEALERKMLKAEKKKFEARLRQVQKLKEGLFPNNTLQERTDNLLPYYAQWGQEFIDMIYEHAIGVSGGFCVLTENES
jgi:bacillithiol biosynthesis cysteine-adding enzyme BshC